MTSNHDLLSSLYENPLAAGAASSELQLGAVCHDRLLDYLLRGGLNDGSSVELAAVASLPHVPPRADTEFAAVASLPHVPPRADAEFSPVASAPTLPPRA